MSKNGRRNHRETFRQDEVLAIKEELLTPEQFSLEMNKVGTVSQNSRLAQELLNHDSQENLSPEVAGALEALDLKLNFLISLQMEKSDDAEHDQRLVSLSSTGIGFSTQERFKKGDHLKIKMNLPMFPPVKLELIGEVVAISSRGKSRSETWIGVSFLHRCKEDEEIIVKYLFKRQREKLRAKDARKALSGNNSKQEMGSGI
ncbi:PilZ domain-containing protein [Mariprofundus aestuarium]|uniref:PilZ domain-containing protein n=1 Tax=Mariprofundus aestuarium TaxID=1921086 RepID=A0A2K8L0Y4_MARES|nr:PilZ domain-containing protein [Mariprofundus aestuarium]ATX78574.1 PilZ domain-containing protein [Mariprofundus aestuarium]